MANNVVRISEAFEAFILSRDAMFVTDRTLSYYRYTLSKFISWLENINCIFVEDITTQSVREYLAELRTRPNKARKDTTLSDAYIHTYARVIRTFLRFCLEEGFIDKSIKFKMPILGKKRLRVLTEKEVIQILDSCDRLRDKCIFSLMVDTGLRLTEVCNLNWGDFSIAKGTLRVISGKGRKDRVVACGAKSKVLLRRYHQQVKEEIEEDTPLFLLDDETGRLSARGLSSVLLRLKDRSGVDFSAHALRRTFAKLALRAGMDIVYIQNMMGHENIETTRHYIQDLDETDVIRAARRFSPIDRLKK